MIEITPSLHIDEHNLHFDFIRAAGPGGQNVNKVATAVQLRFEAGSASLPEEVKARLLALAGQRVTSTGEILIEARRFRTQEQNRADAIQKLVELIRKALIPPKPRRQTRPTAASRTKRLEKKRLKGTMKRLRKKSFDLE